VRRAMSRQVFFCFEDEPIEQAAQVMESRQIRRLVVLGEDRKLAGVVALADLARYSSEEILTDVVEEVSQPVVEARNPDAGRTLETLDLPAE
jgi:CBS-domain-containing membrane protein